MSGKETCVRLCFNRVSDSDFSPSVKKGQKRSNKFTQTDAKPGPLGVQVRKAIQRDFGPIRANSASSSAMRALRAATDGSISASVNRGVMCCGQFQSNASISMMMPAFDFGAVGLVDQCRWRDRARRQGSTTARTAEQLQARAARVVHHEQRDAVVIGEIADADVLPVAAEIGEPERALVKHLDEPGRDRRDAERRASRRRRRLPCRSCRATR